MPGRETAPGFVLRGRERGRARCIFVRDQKGRSSHAVSEGRNRKSRLPAARGAQSNDDAHAEFVGAAPVNNRRKNRKPVSDAVERARFSGRPLFFALLFTGKTGNRNVSVARLSKARGETANDGAAPAE
jgi:hypothetical protein